MKSIRVISLLFILALVACNKKEKLENHIPEDSVLLMKINTPNMIGKVAWNAFFSDGLFSMFDERKKAGSTLGKLAESGLELSHELYLFKTPEYFAEEFSVLLKLKDEAKLKELLAKEGLPIMDSNGLNRTRVQQGVFLSFKGQTALLTITDRLEFLNSIESAVLNESVSGHEKLLQEVINSNHDIVSVSNYYDVLKSQLSEMKLNSSSADISSFQDDYVFGYVDFLEGKIVSDYKYHMGEETKALVDGFDKENEVSKLIEASAGQNPLMAVSMSIDFNSILNIMKSNGMMASVDKKTALIRLYGTSSEEILSFIKGDMFMYVEKVENQTKIENKYRFNEEKGMTEAYVDTSEVTIPIYVFNSTVNNEERLKELIGSFHTMIDDKEEYYSVKGGSDIYFRVKDAKLSITNSEDLMKDMISGEGFDLSESQKESLSNSSYYFQFDSDMVMPAIKSLYPDNIREIKMINNVLESMESKGVLEEDGFNYKTTIDLKNKEDNSLYQIFQLSKSIKQIQA